MKINCIAAFGILSALISVPASAVCDGKTNPQLEAMTNDQLLTLMTDYAAENVAYPGHRRDCKFQTERVSAVMDERRARQKNAPRPKAATMNLNGLAAQATGKRKELIDAAVARVAKTANPPVCPVFTDSELEALTYNASEANGLRQRYGNKSSEASTVGDFPDQAVMRACEKQAKRILFFWDSRDRSSVGRRLGV